MPAARGYGRPCRCQASNSIQRQAACDTAEGHAKGKGGRTTFRLFDGLVDRADPCHDRPQHFAPGIAQSDISSSADLPVKIGMAGAEMGKTAAIVKRAACIGSAFREVRRRGEGQGKGDLATFYHRRQRLIHSTVPSTCHFPGPRRLSLLPPRTGTVKCAAAEAWLRGRKHSVAN